MDDEHSPKSHVDTNYLPLLEPGNEKTPPQSTKPTWRIKLSKYWAFVAHLALIPLVSMVCLCFIDGRTFNVNSRRPQYRDIDGLLSNATSYALLQSDITTAVSLAATFTRVVSGWWATGYIWRCIFVAMERGGISAKGVSQAISSWHPVLCHSTRKSNMVIIYIALFATFAIDYFSAVLTGSFIWEAADMQILGRIPLRISNGTAGYPMNILLSDNWQSPVLSMASASAGIVWIPRLNSPLDKPFPNTTFRRVIQEAPYIPTNSTLAEVTMPYFAVDAFEWVQDPQVLTDTQISLLSETSEYNPFATLEDITAMVGGFLPNVQWGEGPQPPVPSDQDPNIGMPISETRLFAQRVQYIHDPECPQNYTIDRGGSPINLFGAPLVGGGDGLEPSLICFAIANVSYRAGVFKCRNCKIISPNVVEAEAASFSLIGNPFTSYALGLSPVLGTNLMLSTYATPVNFRTVEDFAIQLTSRAYQAVWAALSDLHSTNYRATSVQIALPTLRAKIIHWRVYLWVVLHLWVLALGLLFVYIQSRCDHPWVEDPTMAVFWLDTRAVLPDPGGQRVSDPWQPGTVIREDEYGRLVLDHIEAGQRSVQVMIRKDSGSRQHRYSDSIPLRRRMGPSSFATPREEGRESVETLIGTSVLKTSPLDSTKTRESSAE
ncbi:uncharacterized protein LACBIDRAFT_333513 [Laccaria bicolor S238N-H82]|uniref:Predicted protein n=1 Tax=Laccaria bicolor (strain S238N-H82 / ATCC MYA-4686) TaxID=486041 RepID=B0DW57_LACBS|nr:uncharacterized protein LACBIDRAFT_333513 [Laccaria bicolor S238N-H82]EDR01125.1 predicted protein [Laccaria bicolor S238N-H82]|eukprot:XP_001888167.1 predicted protein [Laccaria bicolor S238N-H82]